MSSRLTARCLVMVAVVVLGSLAPGSRAADKTTLSEDLAALHVEMAQGKLVNELLRTKLESARASGDKRLILTTIRDLGLVSNEGSPIVKSQILEGLALARELRDDNALALLLAIQGTQRVWAGDPSGESLGRQAIEYAQAQKLEAVLPYVRYESASALIRLNRAAEAMEQLQLSYKAFAETGQRVVTASILMGMAQALRSPEMASTEDLAQSESYLNQAIQLIDPGKDRALLLLIEQGLALTAERQGNLQGALQHLAAVRDLANANVRPGFLPWVQYRMGAVELSMGQPKAALAKFQSALPTFEKDGDALNLAFTLLGLAQAHSQLGHRAETRQMLALARERIMPMQTARLTAMYHAAAAKIAARDEDFRLAYDEAMAMAKVQREAVQASSRKQLEEQKVRFEMARKDAENASLRASEAESSKRRTTLALMLAMVAAALFGVVAFLWREMQQKRRFANLALRDELTGAPNRRSMIETLPQQVQAHLPGGGTMIAILDIDHFKRVNDSFGHDVGDEVLRSFYAACVSCLRTADVLGRWGGEEFLLVGHGCSEVDSNALFRRLLNAVQEIKVKGLPLDYRLSFSMGASRVDAQADDIDEAIRRADVALYEAKNAGRARCVFADGSNEKAGEGEEIHPHPRMRLTDQSMAQLS